MNRRVLIECGVAETRAALLIDDVVWKFWFGPARGDEMSDKFPQAGRRFAGRVKAVDHSLNAAFIDIGHDRDAYLAVKPTNEAHIVEGALVEVEVKSPPRQGKGATLRFVKVTSDKTAPGRIAPFTDPAIEAAEILGADSGGEIIVDDGEASRMLKHAGLKHVAHEARPKSLFEENGLNQEFSGLFERTAALPGGGRIVIDEAQALTAIDVDTAGLNASSPVRLREKIGVAAMKEAIRQISLRNIGGHIVIDFPPLTGETQRKRFSERLKRELSKLDGAGAASFSKSGLFSFTTPHAMMSLLERFTEFDGAYPVSGRCFTLEASAKAAIRALEERLRAQPSAMLRLDVARALGDYLDARPAWRERLQAGYGGRFKFAIRDDLEERAFDLSEQ